MAKDEQLFQASNKFKFTNEVAGIRAIKDHVIVTDMQFSQRTLNSGIILLGDDKKTDGIRPRWGKVTHVGPEQEDIAVGQWILVEHGRWSRGIEVRINGEDLTLRRVDPECVIGIQDDEPDFETISTAVHAERKERTQYE
jgi:hypothetical protein